MAKKKDGRKKILRGVVHFYFETGMESLRWAFQDRRFIKKSDRVLTICSKCRLLGGPKTEIPCIDKKSHDFQSEKQKEEWLYEGLRMLQEGDTLTIFSRRKIGLVLWHGVIGPKQCLMFMGKSIANKRWTQWFSHKYSAELIPAAIKS